MSQLYIGIDSGTQGTKAVVLDSDSGEILAEAYATHALLEDSTGLREQDPAWWIAACEQVLGEVTSKVDAASIRGIGVSGQQHGFVPLDVDGNVIRPAKLWCDTATTEQCASITEKMGGPEAVVNAIGNSVAAGFTASKVVWLKDNEPENYERLATILLPHDYINFWLTGERKTECGDASGTAYFDVAKRGWSEEVLAAMDPSGKLAECLPELIESDQPIEVVQPELARKFGLAADVLVSSGGGDNMIAAIGTGNVAPGVVTASLGTSGTIYAHADKPVIDPKGELAAFCSSAGGWLPLICTMNVTVATELTKAVLGKDTVELNALAEKAGVGAGGVMLLPYFNGERTPALPGATASLHGLTPGNYTPENLCRAAMEGATFGLKYGLDVLKRLGVNPTEIRLVGGGAKSKLWRQIVADVFGCPVVRPVVEEAGALGAAIQAVWCVQRAGGADVALADLTAQYVTMDASAGAMPVAEHVEKYADLYEKYLALDAAMRTLNA
ncbi:xylulokinase [Pseudodesulfovibrio sediminis]|uniref:Xylulose kinase n=1 Tax=Pseudodesulfovibrio sediminis TaxID=2810563 RepID=A0ABN6EW85_9BACT|nr:xylulokinase [Pseudodesulfovibrio sediminis]BCS89732.1 xylulokinase [Pseudodesulfovibrio sediminis]